MINATVTKMMIGTTAEEEVVVVVVVGGTEIMIMIDDEIGQRPTSTIGVGHSTPHSKPGGIGLQRLLVSGWLGIKNCCNCCLFRVISDKSNHKLLSLRVLYRTVRHWRSSSLPISLFGIILFIRVCSR